MDLEAFSIQEFLGTLLIGLPILIFIPFIFLEFIARIREIFGSSSERKFAPPRLHPRKGGGFY